MSVAPIDRSCVFCHKPPTRLVAPLRCSACKLVFYCNTDCQRKHWPTHKKVCQSPTDTTTVKVAALVAPPLPTPKDVVYTEDIALVLSTVLASGSLNAVGQRLFLKYKATSSSSIEALVHLGHIISGLPTDHRNSVNDALDGVGDDKAKWLSPTRYQSTPHLYSSTPPKTSC